MQTVQVVVLTTEELQERMDNAAFRAIEKFVGTKSVEKQLTSFVDPDEYGKEMGRHPVTIRRWIHSGFIKGYKVGGRLMIDREEANAIIRQKEVQPCQFPEA